MAGKKSKTSSNHSAMPYTISSGCKKIALKHLPGTANLIADALSRQQVQQFRKIAPEAEAEPTPIPAWLTKL